MYFYRFQSTKVQILISFDSICLKYVKITGINIRIIIIKHKIH